MKSQRVALSCAPNMTAVAAVRAPHTRVRRTTAAEPMPWTATPTARVTACSSHRLISTVLPSVAATTLVVTVDMRATCAPVGPSRASRPAAAARGAAGWCSAGAIRAAHVAACSAGVAACSCEASARALTGMMLLPVSRQLTASVEKDA